MQQPSIELHIEELVLHGFLPRDRERIGVAVERELARLFTDQGLPRELMKRPEWDTLSLPAIHFRQGDSPDAIGAKVAQAVYQGFGQGAQASGNGAGGRNR